MKKEHTPENPPLEPEEPTKLKGFEWPVNALLLLAIVCLALYIGSLRGPFIFDDFHTIVENPYLTSIKYFPDYFIKTKATINRIENEGWRPLWYLSFILNYSSCGLNTFCYHATNVVFHFMDCALVYFLALILFRKRLKKPWLAGIMAALLFAVNPIQTESVSYIVSRSALMATFFYAGAFLLYVLYRNKNTDSVILSEAKNPHFFNSSKADSSALPQNDKLSLLYLLFCILFFIFGLLSKENVVTFPLIVLVYELFTLPTSGLLAEPEAPKMKRCDAPEHGGWRIAPGEGWRKASTRRSVAFIALLFALAGAFTAARFYFIGLGSSPAAARGLLPHWRTEIHVVMQYIIKAFLPFNLNLDPDVREIGSFLSPVFWLSAAGLGLVVFGLYRLYKRDRLLCFLGAWFFIALITETVMPITDFYAEHRLYLPLIGPALLAGYGLENLLTSVNFRQYRLIYWSLVLSVLALMALGTFQRNKIYADEMTVWADTVKKSPNKARPRIGAALALKHYNRKEEALAEFKRALAIEPDDAVALYNAGILLVEMERYNEALYYAKRAAEVLPDYYDVNGLGVVYAKLGRKREAREAFLRVIKDKPDFYSPYLNLGTMEMQDGRYDEALKDFKSAIALKPLCLEAHTDAASALIELKQYKEAAAEAGYALKLRPEYGSAWNMAKALEGLGNTKGAVEYYKLYLPLAPKDAPDRKEAERKIAKSAPPLISPRN